VSLSTFWKFSLFPFIPERIGFFIPFAIFKHPQCLRKGLSFIIGGGESQKVALAGWAGPPKRRIRSMEGVGVLPPPLFNSSVCSNRIVN
jgi:hypothetical protein